MYIRIFLLKMVYIGIKKMYIYRNCGGRMTLRAVERRSRRQNDIGGETPGLSERMFAPHRNGRMSRLQAFRATQVSEFRQN
ncbi:hypothetical protein ACFSR7_33115 [Cohnella sp. GCM10020058]